MRRVVGVGGVVVTVLAITSAPASADADGIPSHGSEDELHELDNLVAGRRCRSTRNGLSILGLNATHAIRRGRIDQQRRCRRSAESFEAHRRNSSDDPAVAVPADEQTARGLGAGRVTGGQVAEFGGSKVVVLGERRE
jgi:hypothetical protein